MSLDGNGKIGLGPNQSALFLVRCCDLTLTFSSEGSVSIIATNNKDYLPEIRNVTAFPG